MRVKCKMDNSNIEVIVKEILREQAVIIGEKAAVITAVATGVVLAQTLSVDKISIPPSLKLEDLTSLVHAFEGLYGEPSVEVCLDIITKYSPTFKYS